MTEEQEKEARSGDRQLPVKTCRASLPEEGHQGANHDFLKEAFPVAWEHPLPGQ